jgi:aryl carrier-like protein
LCAYVVAVPGASLDAEQLRQQLGQVLPEYMVPAVLLLLEKLPLTANGKLDRKALPLPDGSDTDGYEAPQGTTEQALARIWSEVLGVERVGRHDNFFELGGDSILTLRVVARARQHDIKLSPRSLMERRSIATVARECDFTPAASAKDLAAIHAVLEGFGG